MASHIDIQTQKLTDFSGIYKNALSQNLEHDEIIDFVSQYIEAKNDEIQTRKITNILRNKINGRLKRAGKNPIPTIRPRRVNISKMIEGDEEELNSKSNLKKNKSKEATSKSESKIPITDNLISSNNEKSKNYEMIRKVVAEIADNQQRDKQIQEFCKLNWSLTASCSWDFICENCKRKSSTGTVMFHTDRKRYDKDCVFSILKTEASIELPESKNNLLKKYRQFEKLNNIPQFDFYSKDVSSESVKESNSEIESTDVFSDGPAIINEDNISDVLLRGTMRSKVTEKIYLALLGALKPKTLDEINPKTKNDYAAESPDKQFLDEKVWYRFEDILSFVTDGVDGLTDILAKDPATGHSSFYDHSSKIISDLRAKEIIKDFVPRKGTTGGLGIFRVASMANVKKFFKESFEDITNPFNFFILSESWSFWENELNNNVHHFYAEGKEIDLYDKKMDEGDIVFLYQNFLGQNKQFSKIGLFGIGRIVNKITPNEPIFPNESEDNFRKHVFEFELIHKVSNDSDLLSTQGLSYDSKLNLIKKDSDSLEKLLTEANEKWGLSVEDDICKKISLTEKDSKKLSFPQNLDEIKNRLNEKFIIDESVIDNIISSLYLGRHILLTGPVGTGKTDLAKTLPKIAWNYFSEVHTATSDWTTQDVIGGLMPKIENDGDMKFRIQKGCVSSTISKNWSDGTGQKGHRISYEYEDEDYAGVWLVIDEFNRAEIDKAFGQLFTALEYRDELKIPTEKTAKENNGDEFERCLIPSDYRIIGTLNTYDKHFLFRLSDALKRRFDFIEISIPKRVDFEREFDMAASKAISDDKLLENEYSEFQKDQFARMQIIESFAYIRAIKPLGTALLISIIKDTLINHQMQKNWSKCIDNSLVKKIIPQLDGLSIVKLKFLQKIFSNSLGDFLLEFKPKEFEEKIDEYRSEINIYHRYYLDRLKIQNIDEERVKIIKKHLDFCKEKFGTENNLITSYENSDDIKNQDSNMKEAAKKQFKSEIRVIFNPFDNSQPSFSGMRLSIEELIKQNAFSTDDLLD